MSSKISATHPLAGLSGKQPAIVRVKTALCAAMIAMIMAASARAEDHTVLPEVLIKPPPSANTGKSGCAGSSGNNASSLDCLNRKLKEQVDQVNPSTSQAPLDAKSQDIKIGIVNTPAVKQQYGPNYGRSVVPYRPPPLIYSSPLGGRTR